MFPLSKSGQLSNIYHDCQSGSLIICRRPLCFSATLYLICCLHQDNLCVCSCVFGSLFNLICFVYIVANKELFYSMLSPLTAVQKLVIILVWLHLILSSSSSLVGVLTHVQSRQLNFDQLVQA